MRLTDKNNIFFHIVRIWRNAYTLNKLFVWKRVYTREKLLKKVKEKGYFMNKQDYFIINN